MLAELVGMAGLGGAQAVHRQRWPQRGGGLRARDTHVDAGTAARCAGRPGQARLRNHNTTRSLDRFLRPASQQRGAGRGGRRWPVAEDAGKTSRSRMAVRGETGDESRRRVLGREDAEAPLRAGEKEAGGPEDRQGEVRMRSTGRRPEASWRSRRISPCCHGGTALAPSALRACRDVARKQ